MKCSTNVQLHIQYILYTSRVTDTYSEAAVLYICPHSSGSLYAQSDCKLQGEIQHS